TASLFPWRGLVTRQHRVERCPEKPVPIAGAQLCPWNARRVLYQKVGNFVGSVVSPILANIFAHHVLDTWFEEVVKAHCRGQVALYRYADDAVICCQYARDAERILHALQQRLAKYRLRLHEEKTRLVPFSKQAARRGEPQGTFEFLGFL